MQKDHIFVPINSGGDTNTSSVHHKKSFRRVSEPQFYLEINKQMFFACETKKMRGQTCSHS